MNEEDLRDCFAMFALLRAVAGESELVAKECYEIADAMLEARKGETVGLPAIKKRVRK
jgi:hypothetical protein